MILDVLVPALLMLSPVAILALPDPDSRRRRRQRRVPGPLGPLGVIAARWRGWRTVQRFRRAAARR